MQSLEVSGAVRPLYGSLGVKGLKMGVGVGRIVCPETSVTANIRCITPQKNEYLNFAQVQFLQQQYPLLHIKNLPLCLTCSFPNAMLPVLAKP